MTVVVGLAGPTTLLRDRGRSACSRLRSPMLRRRDIVAAMNLGLIGQTDQVERFSGDWWRGSRSPWASRSVLALIVTIAARCGRDVRRRKAKADEEEHGHGRGLRRRATVIGLIVGPCRSWPGSRCCWWSWTSSGCRWAHCSRAPVSRASRSDSAHRPWCRDTLAGSVHRARGPVRRGRRARSADGRWPGQRHGGRAHVARRRSCGSSTARSAWCRTAHPGHQQQDAGVGPRDRRRARRPHRGSGARAPMCWMRCS